jgi:hypothetical protein
MFIIILSFTRLIMHCRVKLARYFHYILCGPRLLHSSHPSLTKKRKKGKCFVLLQCKLKRRGWTRWHLLCNRCAYQKGPRGPHKCAREIWYIATVAWKLCKITRDPILLIILQSPCSFTVLRPINEFLILNG